PSSRAPPRRSSAPVRRSGRRSAGAGPSPRRRAPAPEPARSGIERPRPVSGERTDPRSWTVAGEPPPARLRPSAPRRRRVDHHLGASAQGLGRAAGGDRALVAGGGHVERGGRPAGLGEGGGDRVG